MRRLSWLLVLLLAACASGPKFNTVESTFAASPAGKARIFFYRATSLGGTLTLNYATMAAVVGCVVRSAARHGFKRIFVLNGHGGNIAALETIITELTIELKLPLCSPAISKGDMRPVLSREIARCGERVVVNFLLDLS